jgi:hypothetical protein
VEERMQSTKVLVKALGVAVVGALFTLAAPAECVQAASLINPGAAQSVQDIAKPMTEVRWHHWHRHHWRWHRWHHRHWW